MPSVDGLGDPVVALSPDGTLLYANSDGQRGARLGSPPT